MYITQMIDELNNIINVKLKDLDMSTSLYMIKREIITCVEIWYLKKRTSIEINKNNRNKRIREENHDEL